MEGEKRFISSDFERIFSDFGSVFGCFDGKVE